MVIYIYVIIAYFSSKTHSCGRDLYYFCCTWFKSKFKCTHLLFIVYCKVMLPTSLQQLESWFQRGSKKGGPVSRPGTLSTSRPTSETDFGEPDENLFKLYEQQIESMDEKEIDKKFEELLVCLFMLM